MNWKRKSSWNTFTHRLEKSKSGEPSPFEKGGEKDVRLDEFELPEIKDGEIPR